MNISALKNKCSQMGFAELHAFREIGNREYESWEKNATGTDKESFEKEHQKFNETIGDILSNRFVDVLVDED